MGLFAGPQRTDGAGQLPDRRVHGQVGKVVLALARRTMSPEEPTPDEIGDHPYWESQKSHICQSSAMTETC